MDSPTSTQQPPPTSPPNDSARPSTPTSPIPLTSPLRTFPKHLLPPTLSSTYPHGHISGLPRSATAQAAFESRRAEISRTMSVWEIEKAYEEVAGKICEVLKESEARGREVEGEMEKLRMEREMERRVWGKLRGMKEGG